ncbi:MAG TPA: adenylate/guanylate cyclase domain-containing protein [Xanthobacteraceae bacterium]|jgi:adenylate cyclase|nr:adenylate/guanylate cyclase domain-containing protein [Xanthobacteraceae bacterium]
MDEAQFAEIACWISEAGLRGVDETTLMTEFCRRLVASGLPLTRAQVFIDTLHPTYGGRAYSWHAETAETTAREYPQLDDGEMLERWQRSPFYRLIESGGAMMRRKLNAETIAEFPVFNDLFTAGMTEFIAVVDRFGADAIIGEMDSVYSSWATDAPEGFSDWQVKALRRLTPSLALAIKSDTLGRIAKTLVETYLGRDPGARVLKGSITRGISASIDAVLWFSDLHDYTRICDNAQTEEIIPFLNDYAETVIAAIHENGGDVLKLIGDGTLAIFTGTDREAACRAALSAAQKTFDRVGKLKDLRQTAGVPATDLYLALHFGHVVYGNFGSRDRLDFTVIGPAVNEVSRIAAMCRLIDQPVLFSSAFFESLGPEQGGLVSVGRYALRGVAQPQELFTLDRGQ